MGERAKIAKNPLKTKRKAARLASVVKEQGKAKEGLRFRKLSSSSILENVLVKCKKQGKREGMQKLIAYLRTSTAKKVQGVNGYSFESQSYSIEQYAKRTGGTIVATFSEQESGAVNNRPELMKALEMAKSMKGEATICIAKLDRLSRDAAFLIQLSKSGVQFKCMDMPECDHFTISLFAVLAERERVTIAARVKAAMEAAKRRGVKLGGPNPVRSVELMNAGARQAKNSFKIQILPVIEEIKSAGVTTLQGIADALNRRGYSSRRNGKFHPSTVRAILAA